MPAIPNLRLLWVILDLPRGAPESCRLPTLLETLSHCDQAVSERQDQAIALMVRLTKAIEKTPPFGVTVVSVLALAVMLQM